MSTARPIRPAQLDSPFAPKDQEAVRHLEQLPVLDLLRACRKLSNLWGLNPDAMASLLGTSRSTWFRWIEAAEASREPLWTADQRARALTLLRIFEAAGDLHQEEQDLLAWPHEPLQAPGFEGQTPLCVMQSSFEGLLRVRDYLNFLLNVWS
ncbi:MAG: hypothetical protein H6Q00_2812 [Holophagaceae bacterium]|nr:hypothetical protein [Holophagaceae bacterium]